MRRVSVLGSCWLAVGTSCTCGDTRQPLPTRSAWRLAQQAEVEALLDQHWGFMRTGYTMSIEDDEKVQQAQMRIRKHSDSDPASAHVYGELTANGVRQLSAFLGLDEAKDASFVDLGAGVGKVVAQIFLENPRVRRVLGVELSPTRAENGREALAELRAGEMMVLRQRALLGDALEDAALSGDPWASTGEVDFVEGDMFQMDLGHATHVYMASTSWCPSMLRELAGKLLKEATYLQAAASLKRLPEGLAGFEEVEAQLQTSWTKKDPAGSKVYIYRAAQRCDAPK
ncbi:unnamed protein product [Symbiodinium pilosum]|uniref:Histone-lysine N-methyltransferase, H3 lysine-79 specific n=1 Tax=Symbiodinium pilosum TaxID=2952 RepID=A0A812QUV1_SYMPI|nr:unnamed protein product [Symbiodinium pilosum]